MLSNLPVAQADPSAPAEVSYRLSFPQAAQHYVEVEGEFASAGKAQLEVFMPVWTPGSYLVREYARHVEDFTASVAGKPVNVVKTRKNRWRIDSGAGATVKIRYRVYCRELSVRTSLVERDFALLNGAGIFVAEVGKHQVPYNVQLELPTNWKESLTGLSSTAPQRYRASDFDELVDCPILVGTPAVYRFRVKGTDHVLANQGGGAIWNGPQSAQDVEKIVETTHSMWGGFPYKNYTFINVLGPGGGGLEHKNSTVIMASRYAQRLRKDYLNWLSLAAHEYFHAWNVKRLRPAALGPFDYENENYTPSLWIAEGITAYYDDLLVRRAGFSSQAEYLEILTKHINDLQSLPGRKVQSLSQSSYDTWIKLYRPDENSANTAVSYYVKGPVVAFLLDAEIRKGSQGRHGLDEVMRRAYARYSGSQGYTEAQFRSVCDEVAETSLGEFFARYVDGHRELDYGPALAFYGLRFKPEASKESKEEAGWLGADMEIKGGRLTVKAVKRETPAFIAGINAEDEIIALDGQRVAPDTAALEERLKRYRPGSSAEVLLARREQILTLPVKFAKKPRPLGTLEVDPNASPEARGHLQSWLGPEKAAP